MNAERFEERLMHELKSYVQERAPRQGAIEDDAPAPIAAAYSGRGAARPRLFARLRPRTVVIAGAGFATAVAVSAAVFTAGTAATGAANAGAKSHPLYYAANAAYSVRQQPDGIIKLTILDENGRPDVDTLRSDLAKAGVKASVRADVPDCRGPQPHPSPDPRLLPPPNTVPDRVERENGKLVYYLDPREVVPGVTFSVMYGKSLRHTEFALNPSGHVPACLATATSH